MATYIGPEGNLLETTDKQCARLFAETPILDADQMAAIHALAHRGWRSTKIDMTFKKTDGEQGFMNSLDRICAEAEQAIEDGCSLVTLTDRGVDENNVPVSALLAVSTVHHYLVQKELRTRIGIVVETCLLYTSPSPRDRG